MEILLVLFVLIVFVLYNNSCVKKDTGRINALIKQTSRWSLAAEQDSNPFVANLHANYGVGYLQALKDVYTEKEIEMSSGIDVQKFTREIVSIQDRAARKLIKEYPRLGTSNRFLAELAGE